MDIATVIETILIGIGSGFIAAIIGYMKSMTTEPFDLSKFVPAILLGAVIGGIMAFANVPYDQAYQIGVSAGLVALIENAAKAIVRNLKEWLKNRTHPIE
ncbi:hypothetical protein [Sulfuricurvum sp.]|uniref:hypothetical protein n=1 Tax=Sulfuricurvum sp. TaxID=2025608 RepID=UPI00356945AB